MSSRRFRSRSRNGIQGTDSSTKSPDSIPVLEKTDVEAELFEAVELVEAAHPCTDYDCVVLLD